MNDDRCSRSKSGLLLVGCLLVLLVNASAWGQKPEEVVRAIERGINYLKNEQKISGQWDEIPRHPGGMTALCTLALLSCDVPLEDESISDALAYLRGLPTETTYVVALQTMVFADVHAKTGKDIAIINQNAQWLMDSRLPGGNWSYGRNQRQGSGDNSNTQYALLGLWAASNAGATIPEEFWKECREHWIETQSPQGSWGYHVRGGTGSMTVAGIASLVITGQKLNMVQSGKVEGKKVRCAGAREDEHIRRGLDWIGRFFSVRQNPNRSDTWLFYYLYGLERAGRLTGQRFLGGHDWYREGVRYLLSGKRAQRAGGGWDQGRGPPYSLFNTAFSLLFLSKGKIPILVNKLKYGRGSDWNNAPNDVGNLTEFMARIWKKKLNWQVVDVGLATTEDLLQAPVLQFSGHQSPRFSAKDKKLLRAYVDEGGVLMVDSNCSVEGFDAGFRKLCRELFPDPGQELSRLDPGHGVWRSLTPPLPVLSPDWPLYGVDVGCRTVLFYSPDDLSCSWEHEDDPDSRLAFRVGANIIAYATGPEQLPDKLEDRKVLVDSTEEEIKRNFLQIAKLKHPGDWNPAPRAIPNLMASLRQMAKIDVIRQQREIEVLDPNLANYPLSYMHGRTRFSLTHQEIKKLAEYLSEGGVLLADACCGSEPFDRGFRELMSQLFPDQELRPIPLGHELFSRQMGYDLREVRYSKAEGNRRGVPVLEGIEIEGRYAVIYSKFDLGCALQRQLGSDCKGYDHDSAIKIATNVVLYALNQ